ncbi:sensor histidine kinase [Chitinophagaceae bacterium MMS25-I14]
MKLINKFTLWYLAIFAFVLLAGGVLIFHKMEREIEFQQSKELEKLLKHIAHKIELGIPYEKLIREEIDIHELSMNEKIQPVKLSDTIAMSSQLQRMERQLKASASYKINGRHYYIATYNMMIKASDVTNVVVQSMVGIFILLLILLWVFIRIGSEKILAPFNNTLQIIQNFNVRQKKAVEFPSPHTKEFKELNVFLEKMTNKALLDYRMLKEFSENASHELQTPVAIIRGKLELLMETDITEEQAAYISAIHTSVQKLSNINQSLTLLTRLENHQFDAQSAINISELLQNNINGFSELMEMKSISLESRIEKDVKVMLHPVLADILLSNLFSNAIRHNIPDGKIIVTLNASSLTMSNTGKPPQMPTEELFLRFRKTNQCAESIGLGLAIVKQICDMSKFDISYKYENGLHTLAVNWKM